MVSHTGMSLGIKNASRAPTVEFHLQDRNLLPKKLMTKMKDHFVPIVTLNYSLNDVLVAASPS